MNKSEIIFETAFLGRPKKPGEKVQSFCSAKSLKIIFEKKER
jgi:hypothetical protein